MRWTLLATMILLTTALAGCASTEPGAATPAPTEPLTGNETPVEPETPAEPDDLVATLTVGPDELFAPANVTFTIQVTSGGDPVEASSIQWTLDIAEAPEAGTSGTGSTATHVVSMTEGTYTAILRATATGFTAGTAQEMFTVELPPVVASPGGPYTGARGDWIAINGTGGACEWGDNTTTGVAFSNATSCDTEARLLEEGSFDIPLTVTQGDRSATANATFTVSPLVAKAMPDAPPAAPEIVDAGGSVIGDTVPISHMDIESAWFDSDIDNLYVGLKVNDIPTDPNSTMQVIYTVNFKPSWVDDFGQGGTFTGLRVTAINSVLVFPGVGVPEAGVGEHRFELQSLSTSSTGSSFATIGQLPLSTISADSDMIWWVVPREMLKDPVSGDMIGSLSANTVPAMAGLVTMGSLYGDAASGDGSYVLD